jgi:WD40 repeat protein
MRQLAVLILVANVALFWAVFRGKKDSQVTSMEYVNGKLYFAKDEWRVKRNLGRSEVSDINRSICMMDMNTREVRVISRIKPPPVTSLLRSSLSEMSNTLSISRSQTLFVTDLCRRVYAVESRFLRTTEFSETASVSAISSSLDSSILVICSQEGVVRAIDEHGIIEGTGPFTDVIATLVYGENRAILLSNLGMLRIVDLPSFRVMRKVEIHNSRLQPLLSACISLSPDGKNVAVLLKSASASIKVIELDDLRVTTNLPIDCHCPGCLVVNMGNGKIAFVAGSTKVNIIDCNTATQTTIYTRSSETITCIEAISGSESIILGTQGGHILVVDVPSEHIEQVTKSDSGTSAIPAVTVSVIALAILFWRIWSPDPRERRVKHR